MSQLCTVHNVFDVYLFYLYSTMGVTLRLRISFSWKPVVHVLEGKDEAPGGNVLRHTGEHIVSTQKLNIFNVSHFTPFIKSEKTIHTHTCTAHRHRSWLLAEWCSEAAVPLSLYLERSKSQRSNRA